jgi:hypothetical protein
VTDPSVPAVIETVDVGLRSYFMVPAGEPKLNNPEEVQEAIRPRYWKVQEFKCQFLSIARMSKLVELRVNAGNYYTCIR